MWPHLSLVTMLKSERNPWLSDSDAQRRGMERQKDPEFLIIPLMCVSLLSYGLSVI